jgi:hypothetical protein
LSTSRVKTIVLALLVLINVFFLAVIVIDAVEDVRIERRALENTIEVLRAGGILIHPDSITIGDAGVSSAATVLLEFLAAVRDESRRDIRCANIYSIEPVLQPGDMEGDGEEAFRSMWQITADTGRFLIDEATGEITFD